MKLAVFGEVLVPLGEGCCAQGSFYPGPHNHGYFSEKAFSQETRSKLKAVPTTMWVDRLTLPTLMRERTVLTHYSNVNPKWTCQLTRAGC